MGLEEGITKEDIAKQTVWQAIKSGFTNPATWVNPILLGFSLSLTMYGRQQMKAKAERSRSRVRDIPTGSPTYSVDGPRTISEADTVIPYVVGRHDLKGAYVNSYLTHDGDKTTLGGEVVFGEGPFHSLSNFRLNGSPISSFTGMEAPVVRLGTHDQAPISGFAESPRGYDIPNVIVTPSAPYTYRTFNVDNIGLDVNVTFPYGIWRAYELTLLRRKNRWVTNYHPDHVAIFNGKERVEILVEYKKVSDVVWSSQTFIKEGDGTGLTAKRFSLRIRDIPVGQYDVRVSRVSVLYDEASAVDILAFLGGVDALYNEFTTMAGVLGIQVLPTDIPSIGEMPEGKDHRWWIVKDYRSPVFDPTVFYVDSINEIGGTGFAHPFCAKMAFRGLVTESLSGELPDVTATAEAREVPYWTESGGVYTEHAPAFTRNPSWILGEFLLNMRYGLGELVPTTKFGDKTKQSLIDFAAKSDETIDGQPRHQCDMVNDIEMSARDFLEYFLVNYNAFLSEDDGELVVRVLKKETPVGDGFSEANMVPYTFQAHAMDLDKLPVVVKAQFANEDAGYARELVQVARDSYEDTQGSTRDLSYQLFGITRIGEAQRQSFFLLNVAQSTNVTCTFRVGIEQMKYQLGDVVPVSHNSVKWVNKPMRITQIDRHYLHELTLYCEEYSDEPFDATDNARLAAPSIVNPTASNPNAVQPSVVDLRASERLVQHADGRLESIIDIAWNDPAYTAARWTGFAYSFREGRVYVSKTASGSFEFVGADRSTMSIPNVEVPYTYKIRVASVSDKGVEQPLEDAAEVTLLVLGKMRPPADVAGFAARQTDDAVVFSWSPIADVDLSFYEIREGTDWYHSPSVERIPAPITTYSYANTWPGTRTFMIRAVDSSGNYSLRDGSLTITITVGDRYLAATDDEKTAPLSGAPPWNGTKTKLAISGGNLYLTKDDGMTVGLPTAFSGVYQTQQMDLGFSYEFFIMVDLQASGQNAGATIGSRKPDPLKYWKPLTMAMFKGLTDGDPDTVVYIASNDTGAAFVDADFKHMKAGEKYSGRYFAFRVMLVNGANDSSIPYLTGMRFFFILKKRIEQGDDTKAATPDKVVTFGRRFWTIPSMKLEITNPPVNNIPVLVAVTETNFTWKIRNGGASVAGTVAWTATGY